MSMLRRRLMMTQWENTPIAFEDPEVKRICVENFGGISGITNRIYGTVGIRGVEGELTYKQALGVKALKQIFTGNTKIETFNELEYFSNYTNMSEKAFVGCSNLRELYLGHISHLENVIGFRIVEGTSLEYAHFKSMVDWNFNRSIMFVSNPKLRGIRFSDKLQKLTIGKVTDINLNYSKPIEWCILDSDNFVPNTLYLRAYFCFKNIFVKDNLVDIYLYDTNWAKFFGAIKPISQFRELYPNENTPIVQDLYI